MSHISDRQKNAKLSMLLPLTDKTNAEIEQWVGTLDDPIAQQKIIEICKQLRDMQQIIKYLIKETQNT